MITVTEPFASSSEVYIFYYKFNTHTRNCYIIFALTLCTVDGKRIVETRCSRCVQLQQ